MFKITCMFKIKQDKTFEEDTFYIPAYRTVSKQIKTDDKLAVICTTRTLILVPLCTLLQLTV